MRSISEGGPLLYRVGIAKGSRVGGCRLARDGVRLRYHGARPRHWWRCRKSGAGTQTGSSTGPTGSGGGTGSTGSTGAGGLGAGVGTGSSSGIGGAVGTGSGGSTGAGGTYVPPPYRDAGLTRFPTEPRRRPRKSGDLAGGVPPNIAGSFGAATQGAGPGPTLVYPAPQTMFPPNIAHILFQWSAASGNVFRLHFDTGRRDARRLHRRRAGHVHESGTGGKCWESAADTLMPYLEGTAGGTLRFDIAAMNSAAPADVFGNRPPTRYASRPIGWAALSTIGPLPRRAFGEDARRARGRRLSDAAGRQRTVRCVPHAFAFRQAPDDLRCRVTFWVWSTSSPRYLPILFGPSSQGFPGRTSLLRGRRSAPTTRRS